MAQIPQAARIVELPPADQYSAVELFRGTMVRHSAVVYPNDGRAASPSPFDLTGDDWPRYVPIRMPDTIAVEERLPPGAAAVLINRSHTTTDVYLPIDAREKRLYDAIDGERTIAEIVQGRGALAASRPFFERLYRYDQIVFDASGAAGSAARAAGSASAAAAAR